MSYTKPCSTSMNPSKKIDKDDHAASFDEKIYKSMVGSVLHLTANKPDVMFNIYYVPDVILSLRFPLESYEKKLEIS